ncbi:unnamed protein product [Miscanthus lutarioriparius]|uniref:Uncharacterized protein n=1 Tax=Miscanthus lutarioriparius TaxID=422564 RepID=A0A811NCD0_9POAL|nr:unnamed protein product [Miscanthus lutarioriparius]
MQRYACLFLFSDHTGPGMYMRGLDRFVASSSSSVAARADATTGLVGACMAHQDEETATATALGGVGSGSLPGAKRKMLY